MGVTYDIEERRLSGVPGREVVATANFDTSYTAGGEALNASDVRLDRIDEVVVMSPVSESGYVIDYDEANGTLVAYEGGGAGSTLSEVAGTTDLSTESVRLIVRGTGS